MNALLVQRITEVSRKKSESLAHQATLLLKSLQTSRDLQLKRLSPDDHEKIPNVQQGHSLNIQYLYSQLAITSFLKSKREADKEAKRKTPMDTAPDARVIDVLD